MTYALTPIQKEQSNPADTINWDWSLADMDKLQALASRRLTASEIGDKLGHDTEEIRAVCLRNDIKLWSRR